MEINVYSANDFANFWPIELFNKKYSEEGIKFCSIASAFDIKNPEKTSLIIFRTFIQNGEKAKKGQKYIIGIRFYSFGDMATIDLISLEDGFHKYICYEHLKRMNFLLQEENISGSINYHDTINAPCFFAGGHLKVQDNDIVNFFGDSGDYGGGIMFSDSNSLANYILSLIGKSSGSKDSGQNLVHYLLRFMYNNKLKREFYRNFVADLFSREEDVTITSQNIGALIAMKVIDRHLLGEGDILQLMVDESSGGLARDIMICGTARMMRNKKNKS